MPEAFHAWLDAVSQSYWLFLFVTWSAVRLGSRGTSLALLLVAASVAYTHLDVYKRQGKTTTSVNVAAELAALGWRVLLLDLDSQGHCAVGLGVKAQPGAACIHSLFTNPQARLLDTVRDTSLENLWLAPADQLLSLIHI